MSGQKNPWEDVDGSRLYQAGGGSCVRHNIRELSRAAYSWVFFDAEGVQQHVARGVVWPSLPQTSQAAEQLQLALLPIYVPQHGPTLYCDCMNAVKLHNMDPSSQVSAKQRYG
eukprot:2512392-Pyramimonas_sp.AAC.1